MRKAEWRITVSYVPFESEIKRDQSYRMWVDSFNHIEKPRDTDSKSLRFESGVETNQDAA